MDIVAQVIGFLGIFANIIMWQQKTKRGLILCKLLSDFLWLAHFAFLGAISGAAICVVAVIRELVFMNRERRKWANHIIWPIIFISLGIGSALLTWEGPRSFLPAIAAAASVLAFWTKKPSVSRIISFPAAACMIIYDILSGSISGVVSESICIISAIIGIFRLDVKKKDKKDVQELNQDTQAIEDNTNQDETLNEGSTPLKTSKHPVVKSRHKRIKHAG